MMRYPREGHGLRDVGHQIDAAKRSMAWYDEHFNNLQSEQSHTTPEIN